MTKKRKITASEIYDLLLNEFKIKEQIGSITMKLGNISVKYNSKDAIGDLLQDWLREWLVKNNIYFRQSPNTQIPPDFYLSNSNNSNLLEIKTFNAEKNPAFDVADFNSYCNSLLSNPEYIDTDYLIFGYIMKDSVLTIKDVWLKKVWEITGLNDDKFISMQKKRNYVNKIRPYTWYSIQPKTFKSQSEFLQTLSNTIDFYPQCDEYRKDWLKNVKDKYYQNTGFKL